VSLREIELPVPGDRVPLGGVPTITMHGLSVKFATGVYIDGAIHTLRFSFTPVYAFRFLEEDHIDTRDFIYGLAEVQDSQWIDTLKGAWVQRYRAEPARAFGSEPDKVRHYRVVYMEHGLYEIVCKDMSVELSPP